MAVQEAFRISKIDEDERLVFGFASVSIGGYRLADSAPTARGKRAIHEKYLKC